MRQFLQLGLDIFFIPAGRINRRLILQGLKDGLHSVNASGAILLVGNPLGDEAHQKGLTGLVTRWLRLRRLCGRLSRWGLRVVAEYSRRGGWR